jgi:hypothetical protein
MDFKENINQIFQNINNWFNSNWLALNLNKTQLLEFRTNHFSTDSIQTDYDQKPMTNTTEVRFLGLILDDTLSWKKHIEQLMGKLCSAFSALWNIRSVVSQDTLKIVYFAHIHSLLSYGVIFGGNSSYAKKVFTIQKKSIRIMTDYKPTDSCRQHFKKLKIMTMSSQYICSSMLHTINNKHLYTPKSEIHKYRTRYNNNLHLPIANLTRYTGGPNFSAIKIYNHLPEYIKSLSLDQKHFKNTLKRFLSQHSFYCIQEYYDFKDDF